MKMHLAILAAALLFAASAPTLAQERCPDGSRCGIFVRPKPLGKPAAPPAAEISRPQEEAVVTLRLRVLPEAPTVDWSITNNAEAILSRYGIELWASWGDQGPTLVWMKSCKSINGQRYCDNTPLAGSPDDPNVKVTIMAKGRDTVVIEAVEADGDMDKAEIIRGKFRGEVIKERVPVKKRTKKK